MGRQDASSTRRAAVAVVGGGVIGLSTAAHLAAAGQRDVVLVEAETLGSGSSAKPVGGFRAQFSEETEIALAVRSIEAFGRFEARWGVDPGVVLCGYLLLVRTEQDLARWTAATRLHRAAGIDAVMLSPAEAALRNPYLLADSLLAAQWAMPAGLVYPDRLLAGWAGAARAAGVRILEHAPVTAIEERSGTAVLRTPAGTVVADTVVLATGAWSSGVGEMIGVDLPVRPVRRQLALHRPAVPHARLPFTIDLATGAYFHSMGEDVTVFGRTDPQQAQGFGREFDESWLPGYRDALREVAPQIADLPADTGWAGLYEMTPDGCPLIGETAAPGFRVVHAVGFSGHGVMLSPAVGEAVAALVLGATPPVDVARLGAARFSGTGAAFAGASL